MNPVEQVQAMHQELQAAGRERLTALAWQFVRGQPPEPAELADAVAQAGATWDEFQSIVQAAQQALQAARDMARVPDAETELATIRPKLQAAISERDKLLERAEAKIQQLADMVSMLQTTIQKTRQQWAVARERWPGPLGDAYRQAAKHVAELQSAIAEHEARASELDEMVAARRVYARAVPDATACKQAAKQADELSAKADAVRAEIERLRGELADAERQAAEAEQTLLKLA